MSYMKKIQGMLLDSFESSVQDYLRVFSPMDLEFALARLDTKFNFDPEDPMAAIHEQLVHAAYMIKKYCGQEVLNNEIDYQFDCLSNEVDYQSDCLHQEE